MFNGYVRFSSVRYLSLPPDHSISFLPIYMLMTYNAEVNSSTPKVEYIYMFLFFMGSAYIYVACHSGIAHFAFEFRGFVLIIWFHFNYIL